ncbi:MAG: DUF4912 domain-containing protein [Clostridia bacterium]|nr:DUF4912 domain-containing protein [Clostridia bacterium]
MPRKTKEQTELENEKKETKKTSTTVKKTATKTKKATDTTKKSTAASKKTTTKSSINKKASTTKKAKSTKKNSSATKKVTKKSTDKKKVEILEYYDLPYRYNQTVVKVLAQTPTTLFIYWDISDTDRKTFIEKYGDNFFETTKPILIIHNDTLGYSFEVEINDFANSWYLHVSDSRSDYRIELGRRPINKVENFNTDYIFVSMSNEIESPNDKILFDNNQKMVYFRDIKTGIQTEKIVTSMSFIRNMGKIYNIYDLYKQIYQNENIEEIYDLSNPSS